MSNLQVDDLLFDEVNESKFGDHGITAEQVLDVLALPHVIERNRGGRSASHLLIGRDRGGRCLAVPIEATYDKQLWRPVTAWPCKPGEELKLRRHTR